MDRKDFYFRQKVTEGELDSAFDAAEAADRALMTDAGLAGLNSGSATQKSPTPNISVDLLAIVGYDQAGQRISVPAGTNVDVSKDYTDTSTAVAVGGNEKIVSVFVAFSRELSDPRLDGNSLTVFFERDESFSVFVKQGAESSSPATPPTLESDKLLVADITRTFGQTQVLNANISHDRQQAMFTFTGAFSTIREQQLTQALAALAVEIGTANSGIADLVNELADQTTPDDGITMIGMNAIGTTYALYTMPQGTLQTSLTDLMNRLQRHSVPAAPGGTIVGMNPSVRSSGTEVASQMADALQGVGYVNALGTDPGDTWVLHVLANTNAPGNGSPVAPFQNVNEAVAYFVANAGAGARLLLLVGPGTYTMPTNLGGGCDIIIRGTSRLYGCTTLTGNLAWAPTAFSRLIIENCDWTGDGNLTITGSSYYSIELTDTNMGVITDNTTTGVNQLIRLCGSGYPLLSGSQSPNQTSASRIGHIGGTGAPNIKVFAVGYVFRSTIDCRDLYAHRCRFEDDITIQGGEAQLTSCIGNNASWASGASNIDVTAIGAGTYYMYTDAFTNAFVGTVTNMTHVIKHDETP